MLYFAFLQNENQKSIACPGRFIFACFPSYSVNIRTFFLPFFRLRDVRWPTLRSTECSSLGSI